MRQNGTTNTDLSNRESTGCDDGESYRTIHRCPHYRIGHGSRTAGENLYLSFVEVAVTLLHDRPGISVSLLEKDLQIVTGLQDRGYTLNCHDDACISAELCMPPQKIQAECLEVKKLIEGIMAGNT